MGDMNNQTVKYDPRYKWGVLHLLVFFPPLLSLTVVTTHEDRASLAVAYAVTFFIYVIARVIFWQKTIYKSVILHFLAFCPLIISWIMVQTQVDKDAVVDALIVTLVMYVLARLVFRIKVGFWNWQ